MSCSIFPNNCGELEPNSDIAGIGVYVSFIASAGITLVAVLLKFVSHQRTKYPDRMLEQWIEDLDKYNAFVPPTSIAKRFALGWWVGRPPLELPVEPSREMIFLYKNMRRPLAEALDNSLLSLIIGLADQQAVVALAILVAAALEWETISAYHFNLIASLAWFSSFTHALTLMSLMQWMRRSMFLLCLRLSLFVAVFVMYLWAQAVARDYSSPSGSGYKAACPAHCCLSDGWSEFSGIFTIISMLRVGSLSLMVLLIAWRLLNDCCEKSWRKSTTEKSNTYHNIIAVGIFAALLVAVFGGVTGVAFIRDTASYYGLQVSQAFQDQNLWGFGQIVPMILLILPLIAAIEGFVDERKKQRDEQNKQKNEENNEGDEQNKQQNIPLVTLPGFIVNIADSGQASDGELPLLRHLPRAETI